MGCEDAYAGVRTWSEKFKVCHLQGSHVAILPSVLAEFACGPPSIREALAALSKNHQERFQALLEGKMGIQRPSFQQVVVTQHMIQGLMVRLMNGPISDLPSFEFEAAMKASFTIVADCKSFDARPGQPTCAPL